MSSYDPTIPPKGYPREMKLMFIQEPVREYLFIVVLFTIASNWKQHKYPSMSKWMKKTGKSKQQIVPRITRNKLLIHTTKMDLKCTVLSERSQSQKFTYHVIPFI